jgi:hypothetical protein
MSRRSTILPKYPPAEVTFALITSALLGSALTLGFIHLVSLV